MHVDRLPDGLPPGRIVAGSAPGLWMSHEPVVAPGRLWTSCHRQHRRTGWYPVLMAWPCGHGNGHGPEEVATVDVAESLRDSWQSYELSRAARPVLWPARGRSGPDPTTGAGQSAGLRVPFGAWPGLAAASEPHPGPSPDAVARVAVGQMLHYFTTRFVAYVALVRVDRSADIPAAVGWEADAPALELSALLRTWEDRFGARVIGFEGASLFVSVASPPLASRHAAHVALEHVLTGATNLNDGGFPFAEYAEALRGERLWSFWWD
ncbi:DUF4253 domain-containing protein [Streptomyces sp. NPDC004031]